MPCTQVLLYNLRRCYGLIYRLMASSEPISEELTPVANKLSTVRRCLNEVLKFGGPFSTRDLYPYQLALAQIEAIRVDGKFVGKDGSLPEGQAILNANLSESYEMIQVRLSPVSHLALFSADAAPCAYTDAEGGDGAGLGSEYRLPGPDSYCSDAERCATGIAICTLLPYCPLSFRRATPTILGRTCVSPRVRITSRSYRLFVAVHHTSLLPMYLYAFVSDTRTCRACSSKLILL